MLGEVLCYTAQEEVPHFFPSGSTQGTFKLVITPVLKCSFELHYMVAQGKVAR